MKLLKFLSGLGLFALALSYTGRWFAPGDSLSVGRMHLVLGLFLLAGLMFAGRARIFAKWTAGLTLIAALQTGWVGFGPSGAAGPIVVYQKNLLFLNSRHPEIIADIEASGADFVTLQEVAERNFPVLEGLRASYPHQHYCPFAGVGGVAILSRRPFVGGTPECGDKDGLAVAQVVVPGGPLWLAALHLHWPWPYGQARQVERVLPRLEALGGRVILGGDFNMQPWGSPVLRIAGAVGGHRLKGYWETFPRFRMIVPLIIDHVIVPEGATGTIERRPLAGSDHRGLLARITL